MQPMLNVSGAWTGVLLAALDRVGIRSEELCLDLGIEAASLRDPDVWVPLVDLRRLWHALERSSRDPHLGLRAAQAAPLGIGTLFFHIAMACESVYAMITELRHFQPLVAPAMIVTAEPEGEKEVIVFAPAECQVPITDAEVDFLMLYVLRHWQWYHEGRFWPESAWFRRADPGGGALHRELFRCSVRFGAPRNALVFEREEIHRKSPRYSRITYLRLRAAAEEAARSLPKRPWQTQVWMAVRADLEHPDLEHVAQQLAVSPRSLQRRLDEEGTSFHEVIDTVRREIGVACIEAGLPVREAAEEAGFADASSFLRAFRRWKGATPTHYRGQSGNGKGSQPPEG
jgi:AraC-like DNA-binding protein